MMRSSINSAVHSVTVSGAAMRAGFRPAMLVTLSVLAAAEDAEDAED
jgi:hypothetical protein